MKYYKAQPYNMEHTLCVCLFDDNSRINYSTIAKIFKSNVNSIKRHINSPVNLYKNGRPSIFPEHTHTHRAT